MRLSAEERRIKLNEEQEKEATPNKINLIWNNHFNQMKSQCQTKTDECGIHVENSTAKYPELHPWIKVDDQSLKTILNYMPNHGMED